MKIATVNGMHQAKTEETGFGYYESPIGTVEIGGTDSAILSLKFVQQHRASIETSPMVEIALEAVSRYFNGTQRQFDLPILLQGTAFQLSVWQQLLKVHYSRTASYKDIATGIGNPRAVRAVGLANGKNPISLIVPCHRIIGSDGSLTGYGGGLWRKEWLLGHEARS